MKKNVYTDVYAFSGVYLHKNPVLLILTNVAFSFLFTNTVSNQRLLKETTLISIGTELLLKEFQTIDHGSIKLQNKGYHFALQNTLLFNF